MSSVIFQPLLNDPLGWKPSKSTYADHYKWRKHRITNKDKRISSHDQQLKKLQKQRRKLLNQSLPEVLKEEQADKSNVVIKKLEENRERPGSHRSAPSRTSVLTAEHRQPPINEFEDPNCQSKASLCSMSMLPVIEDKIRPVTASESQPPLKDDKIKEKPPVDSNNDNSRHWLTYPNPRTPQYIIDIKERLGQLKIPSTLARPSSASNASVQQKPLTPATAIRPSSASTQVERKEQQQQPESKLNQDDTHSFLSFPNRETPDDLRAIRFRLDKHRYNPSLDNYPTRPKTCPAHVHETSKPRTPKVVTPKQPENEQLPVQTPKRDVWIVDDDKTSNNPPDYESSSSILVQMVDCDGLPNEYYEALETANVAQEAYLRNLNKVAERRPENPVYRLATATSPEHTNDVVLVNQNHQQLTGMNSQLRELARSSQTDFGSWVRNATDKERASAMKILQEVLNQPIMGYDIPTKQKSASKQAPVPPPVRSTAGLRKLGRTRNQHQFPCEICEKLLIKRHVWDLNGSEMRTCPQHPQSIQARA